MINPNSTDWVFINLVNEIDAQAAVIDSLRGSFKQKPDGSFVTEGDLMVESIVNSVIADAYPDAIVISEETPAEEPELAGKMVFVVDPIDGTENFKSGLPEWGISVACYADGKEAGSMLYLPQLNYLLNHDVLKMYPRRTGSRIAGISSSMRIEDLMKTTPGYEYRMFGCCVYSMYQVITGGFASFENPKLCNSWDILAGLNLALAANLHVSVNGQPYDGRYLPHTQKYSFRIQS